MTPERLHEYRKRAVAWLEYACAGNPPLDSPRHREVKEGRTGAHYSSCADLAHWLYFRLGCRQPWINRDENRGFAVGVNVWRLVSRAERYTGQQLEGGDVVVIANDWPRGKDAHVICVVDQPNAKCIDTAESGLPGNGLQRRKLPLGRVIRVVLPLRKVLEEAEATGQLDSGVHNDPAQ